MQAFTGTPVSKAQLLASLTQHQEQDRFRTGQFWNDVPRTGCGVGCTIHDFAPGSEADHAQYEVLFGIPAELAVLEDHLFEHMHSTQHRRQWPREFIDAIPEGADLDRAAGRFIRLTLTDPRSPIHRDHQTGHIRAALTLLDAWLNTGDRDRDALSALEGLVNTARADQEPHGVAIAFLTGDYVYNRTKDSPYTIADMFLLGSICTDAALCHARRNGPDARHHSFRNSEAEATHLLSRMLLEVLATPQ